MKGIEDKKGIPEPKLEHIFIGTVKTNTVSGYHCDAKLGDEKVFAEARLYSRSKRLVTVNKHQRLFEAVVREWREDKITAVEAMKRLDMKPNTFYRRVKEWGL